MKKITVIYRSLMFVVLVLLVNGVAAQRDANFIRLSDHMEVYQLSEHLYVHVSRADMPPFRSVSSNGVLFVNQGEAILLDTPATENQTLVLTNWIKDSLQLNLVGFIPNHWHNDCLGGLPILHNQGVSSYAFEKTIELARQNNIMAPSTSFSEILVLILGDKKLECWHPGAAHTADNIVVWIPSEKALFAGCMVKSLQSRTLGNVSEGDVLAYPHTLGKVRDRYSDAEIVIPGHGAWGGFDLISHTIKVSENQ